jgi:restriction system protein
MQFLLIAAVVVVVASFWLLGALIAALDSFMKSLADAKRERQQKRIAQRALAETDRALALAAAERSELEAFRYQNPARLVGIPNPDAYRQSFAALDDLTASANAYRPSLPSNLDFRFRAYKFPSNLFDLIRPHPETLSNTEPRKVTITAEDILMGEGTAIAQLYGRANSTCDFPCEPPQYRYHPDTPPSRKPSFPNVKVVPKVRVRLVTRDGAEIEADDSLQAKAYHSELERVASLNSQAALLRQTFEQKYALAREAYELMEIYLGDFALKWRDAEATLLREFEAVKVAYEKDCQKATEPIRAVNVRYLQRTQDGVRSHFELALCNLALPVPDDYPWEVLYDPSERVLQVNQCVPSLADVTVVRMDSKRPPAKRDAEAVLRRLVPAVALQVAHHIACNDQNGDVERIAINCWSRFFEPSSGRLKDAFVASLTASKSEITQINLQRADALEAFRALRGAYVYNVQEVVPIEPSIRLDKADDRFVVGREVLDGMAQGQNLAAMDWQDFEHLIRELLSKEYADKNAEVKITRASRDRGVDAVVFNSDPLHGGKIVVQAKRYSNTVDVAAVRELYGTVMNEGANRGILVTTSHFGRDAYEWAANKQLTLIDGQNLLALLTKHGYNFKIEAVA